VLELHGVRRTGDRSRPRERAGGGSFRRIRAAPTVSRENNESFWKVINEFGRLTGVPIVLNTSFNVRGEAIVCAPEDAIRCFLSTDIDFLALENYLVTKRAGKVLTEDAAVPALDD
jgi:hypothetical protein